MPWILINIPFMLVVLLMALVPVFVGVGADLVEDRVGDVDGDYEALLVAVRDEGP